MNPQDINSGNLGDIARLLDTKDVVNLDWLNVTPGENYDNIPSESPREVIPQLQAQWNNEQYSSPYRLVPNSAIPSESAGKNKTIGEDDIFEVARVAKKAMMQGLAGKDVVTHLRERFSSEVLDAASGELKKVASEDGLLGNVYIDLSPFRTTHEAAIQLGKSRIRLASFVVGSPSQERDYVDSFGRCRNLSKTAVDKVEYSQEVLSHYENHLRNAGVITKEASIRTKEDLRQAFLQGRLKRAETLLDPGHADAVESVVANPETVQQAMASIHNEVMASDARIASQIRIARVRPVLARVQDLMLKGAMDDDLKNGIRACMDTATIQEFAPEIGSMVKKQGIIGPLVVDVSAYPDVDAATNAVGGSFMKPQFIHNSLPVDDGFMEKIRTRTGLPILTGVEDITMKHASEVVSSLHGAAKLSSDVAVQLLDAVKNASLSPVSIIKAAMTSYKEKKASTDVKIASTQQGYLYSSVGPTRQEVDRGAIKTAATKSFQAGLSASSVESKVANYVPIGEAIGIVREAMAAMDEIHADSLDNCQSQGYPLAKTASLIEGSKCRSCVRKVCGACSRQGRSFKVTHVKKASQVTPDIDPSVSMGLTANSLDIDMSAVITPPRKSTDIVMGQMGNINF